MENQQPQAQPADARPYIKNRNVVLCVLFSFITLGIYNIYWFVCQTNETNSLSKYKTASGIVAWLFSIITFGIYGIYWYYMLGKKVGDFDGDSSGGVLYLILGLFGLGIIAQVLAQCALNRVADSRPNA